MQLIEIMYMDVHLDLWFLKGKRKGAKIVALSVECAYNISS